jgi:hypothetical protein
MSKINVRSPYFINISDSGLASVELKLYIYSGVKNSRPSDATYTLNADAVLGGTGTNNASFEVAELVRDYISNTFNDTYSSKNLWVDYTTQETTLTGTTGSVSAFTQLEAFDGYGYFEEGSNPQNTQTILQSNKTIYKYSDEPLRLPVHITTSTEFTFLQDGTSVYNTTLSTSTSSTSIIRYVSSETTGIQSWQDRVEADSGTIESLDCVKDHLGDVDLYGVDTIYVNDGNTVEVYKVENIEECKYNPYKVTFVNKFGALQDLWFFKRANLSLSTKNEEYTANTMSNGSYSINRASKTIFNKTGTEMLKLNTGFYPESYNEIFRQLSLSEEVWIKYEGQTLPIIVKTSSLNYKTSINDKLINYTMDVEFAFNKINNIR